MAVKFCPRPKSKRLNLPIVSCRLPPAVVDEFYAACHKAGVSPSNLMGQMVIFSLANMK